jgi:hypothetical protein
MALRNGQGQRKKYLTLELSSVRNLGEDMCAIVSEFQSAKIGDQRKRYEPQLRWGRADNQTRRGQADSHAELVTATQAGRALCRSRLCVTAVRQRGGVAQ